MNVKKVIKNFNERLRVARNKYGENSRIVKMMIDRAKMVTELEWTEKGISTKKSNIEAIGSDVLKKRVNRYINETRASKIIENALTPEQIKEHRKTGDLGDFFNKVMANKELCERIWTEMYDAGFSPDDCNNVYDELRAGNYSNLLEQYYSGSISVRELADMIINGIIEKEYEDIPEFDF